MTLYTRTECLPYLANLRLNSSMTSRLASLESSFYSTYTNGNTPLFRRQFRRQTQALSASASYPMLLLSLNLVNSIKPLTQCLLVPRSLSSNPVLSSCSIPIIAKTTIAVCDAAFRPNDKSRGGDPCIYWPVRLAGPYRTPLQAQDDLVESCLET